MARYDTGRTGFNPDAMGPDDDPTVRWRYDLGEADSTPVAVAGDGVLVGTDGALHAIDADDGAEQWTFAVDREVTGAPTVVDGTVYFGESFFEKGEKRGRVYSVDARTGSEYWRRSLDDGSTSSLSGSSVTTPTVTDETVFVSDHHHVRALDVADGEEIWSTSVDGTVTCAPSVSDETVFVGTGDDHLLALDADTGAIRWSTTVDGGVFRSVSATPDVIYVPERGG